MGKPHSEATRQKISEQRRLMFLRSAKERDRDSEPTQKRCPTCRQTKRVEDFGSRKMKTKSGLISVVPRTYCRACEAERVQHFKERKIAEGTWDGYKTRKEANRDPVARRTYHREYSAMRRLKQGVKPAVRRKRSVEPRRETQVAIEPASVLLEVLEAQGFTREEISIRSGVETRRLYDIANLATPNTSIDNVDKLLMAFGREGELDELYPLKEDEHLVGYCILDPEGVLDTLPVDSQA